MTGPLREPLADYLALRRALGYRLVRQENLLNQFLTHLEEAGLEVVTVQAALEWAELPCGGSQSWWGYRLSAVRGFATYLHTLDPAHQVPAPGLLPQRTHRAIPYLYSDADTTTLISAAEVLGTPLRRATFGTLIGLLRVTGMRVGEAIGLDRVDIDPQAGRLRVRHGKFDKTRELWLHPTTVEALKSYQRLRDQTAPPLDTTAFFVSNAGTRLLYCNVWETFHRLVGFAGLTAKSAGCRPRIHDYADLFVMPTSARTSCCA